MASLTVRNLDEGLKKKLRIRAAESGRSVEAEVRQILHDAVIAAPGPAVRKVSLAEAIHKIFKPIGGADDVPIPPRNRDHQPLKLPK